MNKREIKNEETLVWCIMLFYSLWSLLAVLIVYSFGRA